MELRRVLFRLSRAHAPEGGGKRGARPRAPFPPPPRAGRRPPNPPPRRRPAHPPAAPPPPRPARTAAAARRTPADPQTAARRDGERTAGRPAEDRRLSAGQPDGRLEAR